MKTFIDKPWRNLQMDCAGKEIGNWYFHVWNSRFSQASFYMSVKSIYYLYEFFFMKLSLLLVKILILRKYTACCCFSNFSIGAWMLSSHSSHHFPFVTGFEFLGTSFMISSFSVSNDWFWAGERISSFYGLYLYILFLRSFFFLSNPKIWNWIFSSLVT